LAQEVALVLGVALVLAVALAQEVVRDPAQGLEVAQEVALVRDQELELVLERPAQQEVREVGPDLLEVALVQDPDLAVKQEQELPVPLEPAQKLRVLDQDLGLDLAVGRLRELAVEVRLPQRRRKLQLQHPNLSLKPRRRRIRNRKNLLRKRRKKSSKLQAGTSSRRTAKDS